MKVCVEALQKARKKKDSSSFANHLIAGLKNSGITFFKYALRNDVFPDPLNGNFKDDFYFLTTVAKEVLEKIDLSKDEDRPINRFMLNEWMDWFSIYIQIGSVCDQNKEEFKQTTLFKGNPQEILLKMHSYITVKLISEMPKGKGAVMQRFSSTVESLGGPISFYTLEHGLINTLDIFTRSLLHQKPSDIKVELDENELNRMFLLCQLWEMSQNIWNKIKLSQFTYSPQNRMVYPVIGKEAFLKRKAARYRFDRMIQDIHNQGYMLFTAQHLKKYLDLVMKVSRRVKGKINKEKSILACISKADLDSLKESRYFTGISELVTLQTIFHDIDFLELVLEDGTNLKEMIEVIQTLRIIGEIYYELNNDENFRKQNNEKNIFVFSKDDWCKLFKDLKGNPRQYLKLLTYPKKRIPGLDIWCTPFIEIEVNKYICLPHILSAIALHYMSEEMVNVYNPDKNSKILGKAFEDKVVEIFESAKDAVVYTGTTDGFEFDCLAYVDNFWFLVEAKRTSTVSSPYDDDRADSRVDEGINQVKLRAEYLLSNEGKDFKRHHPMLKDLPEISPENLVKIVCLNIYEYSGTKSGDIYLTDKVLLKRFILNEAEQFTELNPLTGEKSAKKEVFPRAGNTITRELIENHFMNPVQVRLAYESCRVILYPFPTDLKKEGEFINLVTDEFSDETYYQKLSEYMLGHGIEFDPKTRIL